TMPRVDGEGIVMRILDKSQALIGLDSLGMSEQSAQIFEEAFRRSYGAVLVTGPTGSGKSTTLYGALNEINEPERNIITIEDPVEYQLAGVNQLQVNLKAGLTFASGLRAMLRADPDVIMVGEIRDGETAKIAIESALTGHLVLSTLHTNDAPSTISRLMNMGVEPFLVATSVHMIVAQRLVRRVCTFCKEPAELAPAALVAAGFSEHEARTTKLFRGRGCDRCSSTGYKGRVGLYEVLQFSDEVRDMILSGASSIELKRRAIEEGMETLRMAGLSKIREGVTTLEEVLRETVI
ncbi:MAG: GspE/PulE family protein, partial [Burkholderiales bacterium]